MHKENNLCHFIAGSLSVTLFSIRSVLGGLLVDVSSSLRAWIDVFALFEKFNMAVTESDPDPKVRKMSITF